MVNIPAEALPLGLASNESYVPYSEIAIEDMRNRENDFLFDRNGFGVYRDAREHKSAFPSSTVLKNLGQNFLGSSLEYEEFNHYGIVEQKCRRASETFLTHLLGAETAETFTREVRRRQQSFPTKPRGNNESLQPIQGVHVGTSLFFSPRILRY